MLDLNNVTLVIMTSVDFEKSIDSIKKSMYGVKYHSVKFISHQKPNNLPENVEWCYIDPILNIDQYSYNIIYKLGEYINSDYALVTQSDGYVINPESWDSSFYEYDYIGAIWPMPNPNDNISYRDEDGFLHRVGNGGFSLRSKKLIDLANNHNLKWEPYKGSYNEDGFICVKNRKIYEENGCKFAPLDVAKYFSHEAEIPETMGIKPFGFHGKWSKYIYLI